MIRVFNCKLSCCIMLSLPIILYNADYLLGSEINHSKHPKTRPRLSKHFSCLNTRTSERIKTSNEASNINPSHRRKHLTWTAPVHQIPQILHGWNTGSKRATSATKRLAIVSSDKFCNQRRKTLQRCHIADLIPASCSFKVLGWNCLAKTRYGHNQK